MGFNDLVKSMFDGYAAARKETEYDRKFNELNKTWNCWIGTARRGLLEIDELDDLTDHATTREEYEAILEHLYYFDATQTKSYKSIENKIIHKMWEG